MSEGKWEQQELTILNLYPIIYGHNGFGADQRKHRPLISPVVSNLGRIMYASIFITQNYKT